MRIPFRDLSREFAEIREEMLPVLDRVLSGGRYLLGEQTAAFEAEFASWLGRRFVVACASGTEALALALMSLGIGRGDEVLLPVNTCVPTATGIRMADATPVPVDVLPSTLQIDPERVRSALTPRTRAILPVHLYGAPPDMASLLSTGLPVVEDCAQAHGTRYGDRRAGTFGVLSCFSFYPTKNLGACGDAGAVATDDPSLDRKVRMLRQYGQESRYRHAHEGLNSRMDEIQAAVLRVKLRKLEGWVARRGAIAARYRGALRRVRVPALTPAGESCHHLFPVLEERRDGLMRHLEEAGVETLIHYPVPLHLQPAFSRWNLAPGAFPTGERACREVLSLPLHPQMTDEEVEHVIESVNGFPV